MTMTEARTDDELDRLVRAVDAGRDDHQRRQAVQGDLDGVAAAAADWRPGARDDRQAVRLAVIRAAEQHDGLVHITHVREHLPAWVTPHMVGATILTLAHLGYLEDTGKWWPNGGPSGNAAKPAKVRRLAHPIPVEALEGASSRPVARSSHSVTYRRIAASNVRCGEGHAIAPRDPYLVHVAFPGHEAGYADTRPVRMAECATCATRYGRARLLGTPAS